MTVYILREEFNLPTAEEASLSPILDVFTSEDLANQARKKAIDEQTAAGNRVYSEDTEDDWYVDYHVEPREIRDTVPPTIFGGLPGRG